MIKDIKPVENSTFVEHVYVTPTCQSSKKIWKDPPLTLEFEYYLIGVKNIHNSRNTYNNPAVTKDVNTKNPISPKPLMSTKRVIYQNFRWSATYPTVVGPKPKLHPPD